MSVFAARFGHSILGSKFKHLDDGILVLGYIRLIFTNTGMLRTAMLRGGSGYHMTCRGDVLRGFLRGSVQFVYENKCPAIPWRCLSNALIVFGGCNAYDVGIHSGCSGPALGLLSVVWECVGGALV